MSYIVVCCLCLCVLHVALLCVLCGELRVVRRALCVSGRARSSYVCCKFMCRV